MTKPIKKTNNQLMDLQKDPADVHEGKVPEYDMAGPDDPEPHVETEVDNQDLAESTKESLCTSGPVPGDARSCAPTDAGGHQCSVPQSTCVLRCRNSVSTNAISGNEELPTSNASQAPQPESVRLHNSLCELQLHASLCKETRGHQK